MLFYQSTIAKLGHSFVKLPNFDKSFLCGFSSRMFKTEELRKLPEYLEKKTKIGEEKEGGKCKKLEGGVCKGQKLCKKIVLITATIFALCIFFPNTP